MVSKTGPHAEFRYRRHAPLRRALVEYAKKRGLDVAQLRFWYDCQIVSVDDTPHMLQMQQNSKILVCDSFDAVQVRLLLWDGGASSYADQKVFVGNKRDVVSNLMRNYAQCMVSREVESNNAENVRANSIYISFILLFITVRYSTQGGIPIP